MAESMSEDLARRIVLGSKDTYQVAVEGIGTFTCKRRSFFDDARVEVEAQKYLKGLGVDDMRNVLPSLEMTARVYGVLRVAITECPKGWRLDDGGSTADLLRIYGAIEAEEASFRAAPAGARDGAPEGPPPSSPGVGVPSVQPASYPRGHRKPDA